MNTKKTVLILIFLSFFILFTGCLKQVAAPEVKIENEDNQANKIEAPFEPPNEDKLKKMFPPNPSPTPSQYSGDVTSQ